MMWTETYESCPDRAKHRSPQGPCEDVGQCGKCGMLTFALRPAGETFGFHERDCSLSVVHEGDCVGGGSGHAPGEIRGFWPGMDVDIKVEREFFSIE